MSQTVPLPGPAGRPGVDVDELRRAVDELLAGADGDDRAVSDEQIGALERANTVLSDALEGLDRRS